MDRPSGEGFELPNRGIATLSGVGCLALLLLHWVAPVTAAPTLWGAGTWRGITPGWRCTLLFVGLTLWIAPGARRFDRLLARVPSLSRGTVATLVLLCGAAFWVFQSHWHSGNPVTTGNEALRGNVNMKHAMGSALAALLQRIPSSFLPGLELSTGCALLAILAGCLFLVGSVVLSRAVFPDSRLKSRIMILLLCCAGQSQEFFGVMDSYGLATAGQLWTLAAIATLLRAGAERHGPPSAVQALAACAFTTASFLATLFLWPAVLLAALIRRCPLLHPAPVLAALTPLLLAVILVHFFGRSGWAYQLELFGGADKSAWVPLSWIPGEAGTHFTMFSWEHVAARMNLLCFSSPAWLPLGLVALACTRAPRAIDAPPSRLLLTLGLAALSGLSFLLLVHPDLGPPTDWMQTASGAFAPYVFLIVFCLSRLTDASAARVGTMCIGLSLLHTLPGVLSNAGVIGW